MINVVPQWLLRAIARALFALPRPVMRLTAGGPIRAEGQVLAPEAALLLRLQRLLAVRLDYPATAISRAGFAKGAQLLRGKVTKGVATREITVADVLPATLYIPHNCAAPSPLLVYFHGGGHVLGDRHCTDVITRYLARSANTLVLSVDYRLAPEHRFPAAVDDAVAALLWARNNAESLGVDPRRIAVGGDSAGGNLATVAARKTSAQGWAPAMQVLIYPLVDFTGERRSRRLFADGFGLTAAHLCAFEHHYLPHAQRAHPDASPLHARDLSCMPPTYLVTNGFDPLRDDGEAYAYALERAGVPVNLRRHGDLIHGFVQCVGVGGRFAEAAEEIAQALRDGLASPARQLAASTNAP